MSKIIVVEDDQFSQHFYTYLLNKAGYTPIIIEDGNRIISELSTTGADLVIMDINLKNTFYDGEKVNGIFLSRTIKQNLNLCKTPVLLVTAYSPVLKDDEFFEESLADDFITKPIVDFNCLLDKVKQLTSRN